VENHTSRKINSKNLDEACPELGHAFYLQNENVSKLGQVVIVENSIMKAVTLIYGRFWAVFTYTKVVKNSTMKHKLGGYRQQNLRRFFIP
jgi:hypothetical protein